MKNRIFILVLAFIFSLPSFAQVDRSKMPEPGPAPEIHLGKYESFKLPNGLKVFVVENHRLPRISLSLLVDRDPIRENDAVGYLEASGDLLRTGTNTKTKDQLDKEIDFIGASISTSSTDVFATSLSEFTEKLMSIVSDIVLNSNFKQAELDNIIKRMRSVLAAQKDDPESISNVVENAVLFGKDHPYGEAETDETLDNVTLQKCKDYYSTYFAPNISYLAVVGDITPQKAKSLVTKCFGSWRKRDVPTFTYKTPTAPKEREVALVDRENSVQSVIDVGYPIRLKLGDSDLIKATVANTILGGGVFRLFENLREKHSYTYGAYSTLFQDKVVGNFSATAEVRNAVTDSSIAQILYEMKRIRNEKVPNDELQMAKNYMTGNFAINLEHPQTIATYAINIDRYNLPKDYYQNYLKSIAAVTADDVQKMAQKFILPDNSYIIVVGKGSQIESTLKQFGPVTLYDQYGDKIDTTKNKAPEGVTAKSVIDKYIKAIGGRKNLEKVKDKTTIMSGSVQGMNIKMTIYQKVPNKIKQVLDAGVIKQETYYDGKKGIVLSGGNTVDITGEALESLKYQAMMYPIYIIDSLNIKTKLLGIEKVNGKDAYKIEITLPNGKNWIEYFDPDTGYKIKDSQDITVFQGTFTKVNEYSDFRDVNGVIYPFKLKQTTGPQSLEMIISSIKVNTGIPDSTFEFKR